MVFATLHPNKADQTTTVTMTVRMTAGIVSALRTATTLRGLSGF
jgi:hypothetical protein